MQVLNPPLLGVLAGVVVGLSPLGKVLFGPVRASQTSLPWEMQALVGELLFQALDRHTRSTRNRRVQPQLHEVLAQQTSHELLLPSGAAGAGSIEHGFAAAPFIMWLLSSNLPEWLLNMTCNESDSGQARHGPPCAT